MGKRIEDIKTNGNYKNKLLSLKVEGQRKAKLLFHLKQIQKRNGGRGKENRER